MVSLFFGLPGSGKTTILTSIAFKYAYALNSPYKNVYHNVKSLSVPGTTYIDNSCIGTYDLSNSLILIDEATLFADSRDYKNFSKSLLEFFLEHRHYKCDIYLFSQQWDGIDRKIRVITDRVYYVSKSVLFGKWFSRYYRIPYDIIIPDKKHTGQSLGEIIQGYCKPNIIARLLFTTRVYRPKYYQYYDSFELPRQLDPLPEKYKKIPLPHRVKVFKKKYKKILSVFKIKRKVKKHPERNAHLESDNKNCSLTITA